MLKRNWARLRRSMSIRKTRVSRADYLTKLPSELLHLIYEFLAESDDGMSTFLNLALTCHILWQLAREYIPKEVTITAHSSSSKFTLFERSVNGDQNYARNVMSLAFLAGDYECDLPTKRIRTLLQHLPALRVLQLDGLPKSYVIPVLFLGQLALRDTIERLKIPGGMNVAMVAELVSFPAIQKWRFWGLKDTKCYNEFPAVDAIQLGKLAFQKSQVGLPLLNNILSRSWKLKILETNIPFMPPVHKGTKSREIIIEKPFSGVQLRSSLLHIAKTLTTLNLHSEGQLWREHDGTRLDLSDFSNLTNIIIPALCMCAPLSQGVSRDGLYALLPRSVERFTLLFPPSIGIFYSTHEGKVIVNEYSQFLFHGVEDTESRWIYELALHRVTRLPKLWQVCLLEDQKGLGDERYGVQNWLLPDSIKSIFKEARIQLSILLRKNMND